MDKKVIIAVVAIIVVVGGVFIYKSGKSNSQMTTSPEQVTVPSSTPDVMVSSDSSKQASVKEFTVSGSNFKFEPSQITVNKGDTVKITFKNTGGIHDLVIPDFNVATQKIQGDQQEVVQFVATKTGSFEYYCSVSNHRDMGMKGTLVVN